MTQPAQFPKLEIAHYEGGLLDGTNTIQRAGTDIALFCRSTTKEEVEHIVHCVNTHAALVAALVAQEEADKLDADYTELCDRAAMEGWEDDPTGASHVSSAYKRVIAAHEKARALRAAALAKH